MVTSIDPSELEDDSVTDDKIAPQVSTKITGVLSSDADTSSVFTKQTTGTNGGITKIFVGDRDPNGSITGAGGDKYVRDSGDTSGTYENRALTTSTVWLKRSLVGAVTVEIHSLADLEELATANVITVSGSLHIKLFTSVTTPIRFVLNNGSVLKIESDSAVSNLYVYTGTSTLFTATDGAFMTLSDVLFFAVTLGTQFIDYTGSKIPIFNDGVSLITVALLNFALGSILPAGVGIAPVLFMSNVTIVDWTDSMILDSLNQVTVQNVTVARTTTSSSNKPLFDIRNSFQKTGRLLFNTILGRLEMGESFIRVDAGITDATRIDIQNEQFTSNGAVDLFDTSGISPTAFTAVADNSIGATDITSVTDSGGFAVFNHGGTSPLLGSIVTVSGFTTNTNYNVTGTVSSTTATTFQVDFISFGTTETGSYLVNGVTITSASHGLSNDTGVLLDTTDATDYDAGFIIYNVQTNTFDVNATFTVTKAGTWTTKGSDQKNRIILATSNPGFVDSKYIACAFVNDNSTAVGTIVNNTFTDLVFGTAGSALIESSTTERWKLIDELNGTFECVSLEPVDGPLTFDFTLLSSGGSVDFRFKWEIDTGSGFEDLPDAVESLVDVGNDAQSITKTFPLAANKGDKIRPQITRNSGTSTITVTYATIYASG